MRKLISKIILGSLLSTGSLMNVACSSGGFTALNATTAISLANGVATSPDDSSDIVSIPEQPADPRHVPLTGASASELYTSLVNSGIVDASGRLGATTLEATEIACTTPLVLNGVTSCRVYTTSSTLNMPEGDATKVNSLFSAKGGQVNDGNRGASATKVYNVVCIKVVYPGATPACSLSIVP